MPNAWRGQLDAERSQSVQKLLGDLMRANHEAEAGRIILLDLSPFVAAIATDDGEEVVSLIAHDVFDALIPDPEMHFQRVDRNFVLIFAETPIDEIGPIVQACIDRIRARVAAEYRVELGGMAPASKRLAVADILYGPDRIMPELGEVAVAAAESDATDRFAGNSTVELRFRPIWRASKNVIGAYLVSPQRALAAGGFAFGYDAIAGVQDLRRVAVFDQSTLRASGRAIEAGAAAGENFVVVAPIFLRSFIQPNIMPIYFKTLLTLPQDARRRLTVILSGVNHRVDARDLKGFVDTLSSYCGAVLVDLPIRADGCPTPRGAKIGAVGASAAAVKGDQRGARAVLESFVRGAAGFRSPFYLTDVDDPALARAAVALGFEFLAGDVIGPALQRPQNVSFRKFDELRVA